MPNKGKFIGSQDNLFVPDAPTIGSATAGSGQVSVAFTAPSDVGGDAITLYGASAFLAGATINYRVSVGTGTLSTGGSGNVYFIDGIPTKTLSLIKGFTYVFDMSDSSNSGHPLAFKNASDGSYTTGVTTSGTAGSASATVTLVLATDASEPSSYYCTSHGNGMGNTISLIEASASTDPLGAAQAGTTGSSSPITVTGLSNGTSYIAQVWAINDYGNGPLSAATASFTPVNDNAFFILGQNSSGTAINSIDQISVGTTGNGTDWGDLTVAHGRENASGGNNTRVIAAGGHDGSDRSNVIDYFSTSSSGNASDFGDLIAATSLIAGGINNNVRSIFFGGDAGGVTQNVLQYVTIQSTGNSTDFGDLLGATYDSVGTSSSTRGITFGGTITGLDNDTISYVTIASSGNATNFGNLSNGANGAQRRPSAVSSSTRAVKAGGYSNEYLNIIEYITIASTGNATDFGDLSRGAGYISGAESSTRGVFTVSNGGSAANNLEYITIASTGNSTDFGDLTISALNGSAHGANKAAVQNETGFAPAAIGLFAGGEPSAGGTQSTIEYIDIATTGNAAMFGDLTGKRFHVGSGTGVASATRGVFLGGHSATDTIEYVTFSTKSKATDFGNLTSNMYALGAASNSTRGLGMGGHSGAAVTNVIQYITIASAGNATDFGDLNSTSEEGMSLSSTTRAVHAIGASSGAKNTLEYVTIASTGDATDFGDLTDTSYRASTAASNTRGVVAGGLRGGSNSNVIDYITTASTGNATDFGDLTSARSRLNGVSSGVRGVFGSSHDVTVMDYVTIASTGNATDFGDMFLNAGYRGTASSAHGGIA